MNWLNLRTEILHSPEFIGSDPTRRAKVHTIHSEKNLGIGNVIRHDS